MSVNAVSGVKNRHRVPRHGSMSTICYFVFRTRSCAHIASETYTPSMTSKIPTPPAEATKPIGRNRVVRNTSVKLAVETMNVTKPPYLRNAVKRPTAMPISMAKTRCTTGNMKAGRFSKFHSEVSVYIRRLDRRLSRPSEAKPQHSQIQPALKL